MNTGLPSKWRSINETANAAELMNGVIIPDFMIDLYENIKDNGKVVKNINGGVKWKHGIMRLYRSMGIMPI